RMELYIQQVMAAVYRLHADLLGQRLECRVLEKTAYGLRHWAVSVRQFRFGTVPGLGGPRLGHLPGRTETLVFVHDVAGRDADIEAQVQSGVDFRNDLFALQFADGLFEQADVCIEPDRIDVSVLFATQEISRPAQLEVQRGDLESGS